MNTQGFYKKQLNEIIFGADLICGVNYMLLAQEHDKYDYPVDGWIWANNLDEAIQYFANNEIPIIDSFEVQPENFKLSANKDDEAEFSKLIVLLNIAIQQGRLTPASEITIWDHLKQPHIITVSRFLEIMVDYGLYCYSKR